MPNALAGPDHIWSVGWMVSTPDLEQELEKLKKGEEK